MKQMNPLRLLAFLILVSGAVSCTATQTVTTDDDSGTVTTVEDSADHSRMEELYWNRVDSARMNFSEADVQFMIGMIGHHAQALIMSRLAPENGASPQVQTLAARIINAQKDEIASMQEWLRYRDQPVPEVHIDGLNLMVHGVEGHMSGHADMPGILSREQLEELAAAKGAEFDRLFLKYMIEHHTGAVTMVRNLFATDGAAQEDQAFRLASDIQVDQITEIERMKLMLENMSGTG